MRPRSKLLSKRRTTLPTIREGSEEAVRDLNEANTLHTHSQAVSSEDYLLSICHLAHPTFATRAVSQPDAVSRHSGATLPASEPSREREGSVTDARQDEGGDLRSTLMFGYSDPLEYLYGHHSHPSALPGGVRGALAEGRLVRQRGRAWEGQARGRAHSIPRTSSPDFPRQRKSSCPELRTSSAAQPAKYPNLSVSVHVTLTLGDRKKEKHLKTCKSK
uniref:Uncharacterized protein n=1 Tax=Salarias fasciatus TaxID=181472 RepID=A0A672ILQ2_SALFA